MALKVAVQMDPIASINPRGDSTFAMMLEAQARGHQLGYYTPDSLALRDNQLSASIAPVEVFDKEKGQHYALGEATRTRLDSWDVVLMRQDPPFDMNYITLSHMLERIHPKTFVMNPPAAVRNAPEKVFVLDFPQFMPPTMVTRDLAAVKDFQSRYGAVVIKPLHGNGGKAVFRVDADGSNLGALVELFGQVWPEPFMVQQFLPSVAQGDKRIVLVDGEVAGAINRKPGEGEFRSNLAVGGSAEATTLTAREEEICAAMGPRLKELGLIFVGIDVIGGEWLTEINVTSPTGIVAIDRFNGTDTAGKIWDAIEGRLRA